MAFKVQTLRHYPGGMFNLHVAPLLTKWFGITKPELVGTEMSLDLFSDESGFLTIEMSVKVSELQVAELRAALEAGREVMR